MYNNQTARQLSHLVRKKPSGIVHQFGDTDMSIPMTHFKAYLPKLVAPTDPKTLWEELGYTWSTTNRKADIVLCGDALVNNMDINTTLKEMWNKTKVNGHIVITVPSSITSNYFSIQPNYFIDLQNANQDNMAINYFHMGDISGQHCVAIDASHNYEMHQLRDHLHKFVETREMITNITLVNLSTKELICP